MYYETFALILYQEKPLPVIRTIASKTKQRMSRWNYRFRENYRHIVDYYHYHRLPLVNIFLIISLYVYILC